MKVIPMNGHIFVAPLRETKTIAGVDLIAKFDEEDRYRKATVIFVDEQLPLKEGDVVLYDGSNGHGFHHEDKLLTVLTHHNIVGVL